MLAAYVAMAAGIVALGCVATEAGLCGTDIIRWGLMSWHEQRELRRRYVPWELSDLLWKVRSLAALAFLLSALWMAAH